MDFLEQFFAGFRLFGGQVFRFFVIGADAVKFVVGEVSVGDEFPVFFDDGPGNPVVGFCLVSRPGCMGFPEEGFGAFGERFTLEDFGDADAVRLVVFR